MFAVNNLMHNLLSCLHMGCSLPFGSNPPANGSLITDTFEHYLVLRVNIKAHSETFCDFLAGLHCLFGVTGGEIKGSIIQAFQLLDFLKHALHLSSSTA